MDKKKKSADEMVEPTIVEVYGDDEVKTRGGKEKESKVEEKEEMMESVDRPVVEVLHEPVEQENVSDNTMKTEVVDTKALTDKQDETAFDEEIGSQRKAVRSVFGVGLIVFLVIFGLTGWAFYLKTVWLPTESVSNVLVAESSPTPLPTTLPSPTPLALARAEITLEILNGSGVPGLAGKVGETFEKLGYSVSKVGNGDAVKTTQLLIKKDQEKVLEFLMADVKTELKVASIAGYLKDSDVVTARIILGN